MTIKFPDLSSYEGGVVILPGTVCVVAKATEGDYYKDAYYESFKLMASHVGAIFSGYHFLKSDIDPAVQAKYYYDFAGNVPCMLDVETEGTSTPTVDEVVSFQIALERLGGHVWGVYYPKWYWDITGGNLGRLEAAGAVLVSSDYVPYSDTGPGWSGYGNATPKIWQYTNSENYNGHACDFNAFKGTLSELSTIIHGDNMALTQADIFAIWGYKNTSIGDTEDMRQRVVNAETFASQALAEVRALAARGSGGSVDPVAVADAELAAIKAKL